jgi:hypothetical protein
MLEHPGAVALDLPVQVRHVVGEPRAVRGRRCVRQGVGGGVIRGQHRARRADAFGHRLIHRELFREHGFLRNQGDARRRRDPQLALVERGGTGQHLQQRRFPGAVAPDQRDPLAGIELQFGAVEQRAMSVRQRGVLEAHQHGGACYTRRCSRLSRPGAATFQPPKVSCMLR